MIVPTGTGRPKRALAVAAAADGQTHAAAAAGTSCATSAIDRHKNCRFELQVVAGQIDQRDGIRPGAGDLADEFTE
jgi:hypothetical protein